VAPAALERRHDPIDRLALGGRERLGLGLPGEPVATGQVICTIEAD